MLGINLQNVESASNYPKPAPGAYVIEITKAVNNKDKERIELEFDICAGDFAGYYKDMKDRLGWHSAKFNKSYKTKALGFLKSFIQVILDSNGDTDGLVVGDFEDIDETKLVGKKLGIVVGEAEYMGNDGTKKVKLDFYNATFIDLETYRKGEYTVPDFKPLAGYSAPDGGGVVDTTAGFEPMTYDDNPF